MLVLKFGGTSVGNAASIESVCRIIKARLSHKPVVVVSAIAGVTNTLVALGEERNRTKQIAILMDLRTKHEEIVAALGLTLSLDQEFDELTSLVNKQKKYSAKKQDACASFGERLSAKIVAAKLNTLGVPARAFPAWEIGMITDEHFGGSEPLPGSPARIKKKLGSVSGLVPVITGYIGKTKKGEITTLGRGGSDYSAAIIGAALKAEAIQIWKEVDGIMTTDPRLVPEAKVIPELAFEEAAELAYFGAKVLHPKTILPAMEAGVPVQVLNTFNPSGSGTTIVANFEARKKKSHVVEALTFKKKAIAIHIASPEFFDNNGLMARIFELFDTYRTSIDVVSTSVVSISLTTNDDAHLKAIVSELQKFGEVVVERSKAIVCAVGGSVNAAGVAGRMFTILGENNIPVEMISQSAGGISITFVVEERDAEKALRVLHKEYIRS